MCVGTLVSRTAVLTAAVCVTHPVDKMDDPRPINVVTGTSYRHPRRGIRVQVTKVIIPKWGNITNNRGYLMQISPALLMLMRQVPDVMTEIPLRPITIAIHDEDDLSFREECAILGWHFFYKGDKIFPVRRFLLQKNVRVQYMDISKKHVWCEALTLSYQKALQSLGFFGYADQSDYLCIRDGMYGAPVLCRGKVVAMMMAPDAQWVNCTGFSNMVHTFGSPFLQGFMNCIMSVFVSEYDLDWPTMQKAFVEDVKEVEYDYLPEMYDTITGDASSTE